MSGLLAVAALALAACTQKPATIEFAGTPPTTIETMDAIPLPKVVVKDKNGEPLEEQPALDWSTKPEGIVQIAGGTLSPIKSGETQLIARVKDSEVVLEQPLKVQLVERITVSCEPESCRFAPGTRFRLRAEAKSGGGVVEGLSFEWSGEPADVLESLGGGEFLAKKAGSAKVQAAARGIVAHQNVLIEAPVDQLLVICPNPPSVYIAPSADTGTRPSCVVKEGDTLALAAEVRGQGEVMERRAAWSSTNPTYVDVSSGRVTGVKEGAAIVEARVENLFVAMPVEVRRAANDKCDGSFQERLTTTLEGAPASFACGDADATRCFEKAISKAETRKKPLSPIAMLAAAKGCCCVEIPALKSAAAADATDGGPTSDDGGAP